MYIIMTESLGSPIEITQTLGGINSSLYQVGKQFHYTRIVEERFYSILLTKVAVGEKVIDVSCKKVYVHMIIIERA